MKEHQIWGKLKRLNAENAKSETNDNSAIFWAHGKSGGLARRWMSQSVGLRKGPALMDDRSLCRESHKKPDTQHSICIFVCI